MVGKVQPAKCRRCNTLLQGCSYLQIGAILGGHNKLCMDCLDKMMGRSNAHTVREFVTGYIKEHKPDTVQSLKQRLEDMERLLEELTNPKDKDA